MREVATALGGIGLLIFAYLLFTRSDGASQVLNSLSGLFTNTIGVLQGNTSGGVALGGGNPLGGGWGGFR